MHTALLSHHLFFLCSRTMYPRATAVMTMMTPSRTTGNAMVSAISNWVGGPEVDDRPSAVEVGVIVTVVVVVEFTAFAGVSVTAANMCVYVVMIEKLLTSGSKCFSKW